MAYTSKSRFIRYLRGMGMVIGEYTEFASPIHSEVDLGRAKYISIGDHCMLGSGIRLIAHDYSWKVLEDAYYQKRKETYVTDAKKNAQYIWSHTGKLPVMDEMINFAVLFMPRTAENIQKYILRRHRVGGNAKRYAEILQDTEQLYPDYRAFLVDALGEDVVKREMKKDFPKE